MTAKVINLFAGPSSGKSTTAAGLFYELKLREANIELVTEYAKDKAWEGNKIALEDQLYITAKQNKKLWVLRKKVDIIVSDSPLLLGIHYRPIDYFPNYFEKFIFEVFSHYENINFFIKRQKKYNPNGRFQTEDEAKQIDTAIIGMLDKYKINYTNIVGNQYAVKQILTYLEYNGIING